jgi:signal transduction histidine kinase/CheY-like chemotaxis protein
MNPAARGTRILHLGSDPSESALLAAELRAESIPGEVALVATQPAFRAALAAGDIALLIADLPLPFDSASTALAELQRTRPELRVIFRTGSAGDRRVMEPGSPTAAAVRAALEDRLDDPEASEERRRIVERVVRSHAVQLRLSRRDLWDFEDALKDVTKSGAQLLEVGRVSVWEVDPTTKNLTCVLVYDRLGDRHSAGERLELPPSYVAALESAMFVAADDAQHDPRTSAFTKDYLAKLEITSMLDAPVRRDGRIVGVLCHEHSGPLRHWSLLEQCTAAALAEIVARALEVRDRRRAEARLRESEKFEVIGRFTGRLAHDFNNLLTVILGNAQLSLARHGQEPGDRELLQQIVQAGEDATALIRQLLTYARREPIRPCVIDLRAQLGLVMPMIRRLVGADVAVKEDLGRESLWVDVDPTQLQQILLNLAANARDAMPKGGEFRIGLARAPGAVHARGEPPSDGVRLSVRDTGAGIDPEVLPRIFEPFFTTKEPRVGTGLGLASVREIVHRAGGEIEVTSRLGEGTQFHIVFPEAREPAPAKLGARANGGAPGETALLVEADADARKNLARLLEGLGTRVVEAGGPVEALEVLARGTKFDWVATAQSLPKMDGARLIRHLRDFRPRLPAVLIAPAGKLSDAELEALRQTGPTSVLAEPVSDTALAALLKRPRTDC